jgi:hypothetical protein
MKTEKNSMKAVAFLASALLSAGGAFAEEKEAAVTDRKVSVVGFVDAGQVVKGSLDDGSGDPESLNNAFLNRNGIALTYSGTLNGNLHMNIGVGGLFWKPIPETSDDQTKRIGFGPGISEASAQYDFSEHLNLKFGFFGYKYNPDAPDLGEYLLRSEAYPSIVFTAGPGGWVWLNSNEYKSMGAKLTWETLGGALKQDFLIFSEFNNTPIFDFSPTYVATLKAGKSFEFGAGVSLHRFLPIHPSVTTPTSVQNTYVKYNNFPEVQYHATVFYNKDGGGQDSAFASWRGNSSFDQTAFLQADPSRKSVKSVKVTQLGSAAGTRDGLLFQMNNKSALTYCEDPTDAKSCSTNYLNDAGDGVLAMDANGAVLKNAAGTDSIIPISAAETRQFTFKAIKVMARASLNLGSLFGMSEESTGPFKIFGEAAVLGVQNQPYLYDKIQNRIPIMIGADIPTFGLLDLVSLQMEYFKNPLPDNNINQFQDALPLPAFPKGDPALYEFEKSQGTYSADDIKWSIYLKKSLFSGLDAYLQVANDHFRVQNVHTEPSYVPVTHEKSDWFYMLRFQWSM